MKTMKIIVLMLLFATALPVSADNCINTDCRCVCPPTFCGINIPDYYVISNDSLYNKLKGRIILTVQSNGEAYYVSPVERKAFFLGDKARALKVLQNLGSGTYNETLDRIPVGHFTFSGNDDDMDGLPNAFEIAIGTDLKNFNSDGDRYSDKTEIDAGYSAKSDDTTKLTMSSKLRGKVYLQTEHDGEAWYMNPVDGRRYWLNTNGDIENIIKKFGLGISNYNFNSLVR